MQRVAAQERRGGRQAHLDRDAGYRLARCVGMRDQHRPMRLGGAHGCSRVRPLATRAARASDRKSTRLNSSHQIISYTVFCLKKEKFATSRKKKLSLLILR